jgi:hypothetical protein
MILGLSLLNFTFLHVFFSLVGIAAGFFTMFGMLTSRRYRILTAAFFVSTAATCLTGFLFPFKGITPGIVFGILTLIALILAYVALYTRKLAGPWRGIYVLAACVAYYFNFLILIAQTFADVPMFKANASAMTSPAFGWAQLAVLVIFILLTTRAFKKFHPV